MPQHTLQCLITICVHPLHACLPRVASSCTPLLPAPAPAVAHPASVERLLRGRWGRRPAREVLGDELFYFDALRRCHAMEMTLLLHASRPLPLAGVQQALEARVGGVGGRLGSGPGPGWVLGSEAVRRQRTACCACLAAPPGVLAG